MLDCRVAAVVLGAGVALGARAAHADEPSAIVEPSGIPEERALPQPTASSFQETARPPPLHVEYAQYGVALTVNADMSPGAVCGGLVKPNPVTAPCILGSGGGLAIRGGYRSPGPWYIGGAYEFTKMDSANLYRLGIFQQFRFEMRYIADFGYRVAPFATWGGGGLLYGNEWGAETGGALAFAGAGVELEVSRTAVVGVTLIYRPALIIGWTDTAGYQRPLGLAQFLGFELRLEVRSELGRK